MFFLQKYSSKMNIKSFIFLDSETTGLPAYEHNKTKITELCLISAQADQISLGVIPRVQNKIILCFNPQKRIQPEAENITGLFNDELVNESSFDETSVNLLINFIERLKKPVCFVAHNGFKFDYPILRSHIDNNSKQFPEDILCIDSLRAFKEILNEHKTNYQSNNENKLDTTEKDKESADKVGLTELTEKDEWDDILYQEVLKIEETFSKLSQEQTDSQNRNETTPPTKKPCNVPAAPRHRRISASTSHTTKSTVQRKLNFDQNTSKPSFSLSNVYERLTENLPSNAHQAEEDVKMLLACAVQLGDTFITYANKNAILFKDIPKMQPGVKIASIP